MILPFVRELMADLESAEPFERVRRHLAGGTGRRRVSGLTATARALYLPYFIRAAQSPALILVADNKAAEALHANLIAACDLTGVLSCDEILRLPAHDVLPFENVSPHPEIQEQRAAALWKLASGAAMRRSQVSASSSPPPSATPLIAATLTKSDCSSQPSSLR